MSRRARDRHPALVVGVLLLAALALVPAGGATAVTFETTDVFGQGPAGPVVSPGGATLQRGDNGISVRLRMPTPQPGSYVYPPVGNVWQPVAPFPGHPEAFSLWVFVFNYPELCSGPCDGDDVGIDKPAMGGAFNGAGHLVGGPQINFSGHVSRNTVPLPAPSGVPSSMLLEPRTAEVHLAVAPHGALQPDVLPNQITKPIGSPSMWWLAIFD